MAKSRTKNVAINVTASIVNNVVSLICGLILPRLILSNFGSEYNGITQSITQFISYISLMQSGIGGATAAALYKPLANKDNVEISEVLAATQKFMRKISFIFVAFVAVFAVIYPIWICTDFDWFFSASLIVIISLSTFAQYYFGFTYQCLLGADQKAYIVTYLNAFTVILNAIVSVILINNGCSIHIVKLGASIVHIIPPIFMYIYVRKKYHIIDGLEPKEDKIPQKWNAAAHEVASFVNDNTDIVILTMFVGLKEISVYSIYHYVTSNIKKILTNFTVGFGHAFGDMYARNELELMKKNLGIYETIIYSLTTILCTTTLVMFLPFVALYTKGINDVNYIRPTFAIIMTFACAFNCFRVPYRSIVYAVGHYRQTRNGAIFEAVMNITISIITVYKFGLVGVAIGTMCAMAFRTFQYGIYLSNNIITRNNFYFIWHICLSFITMILVFFVSKLYIPSQVNSWISWIIYSCITGIIATFITIVFDIVFYKNDFSNTVNKLLGLLKRKVKH